MIMDSVSPTLEPIPIESGFAALRGDFPILRRTVHGKPLVYFDNAATTQKPQAVIDAVARFYSEENANVHRGIHFLSERATAAYESARARVQRFVNAEDPREIIFVRGATEAINLVAQTWGRTYLDPGDEIIVSTMEHHANIIPWQMLCNRTGAVLRVIPITDNGELILDEYARLLGRRTKLVSVMHVSNVLGTINPIREIVEIAHDAGVPVLVDGAQAVGHMPVDVRSLGADFYAFSAHKMYGPTGIGALYGRANLLETMPPYQGGGDMMRSVTFDKTEYDTFPARFEAGTPHIAGAIGLATAIDYLAGIGLDHIAAYEDSLLEYAGKRLAAVGGVHLLGNARSKAAILSFVIDGVHPHNVGTIMDHEGIAIRTGHHCCQPLLCRLGIEVASRASLALYNTREEVDRFVEVIADIRALFGL